MMQALELLQLAKGTSQDKATLNNEEIKPATLVIIELCLSEGISQSVENSVTKKFFKFHINLVEWFMVDLKKFLGLAMPNQSCLFVEK